MAQTGDQAGKVLMALIQTSSALSAGWRGAAEKLLQQKVPTLFRSTDFTHVVTRHRNCDCCEHGINCDERNGHPDEMTAQIAIAIKKMKMKGMSTIDEARVPVKKSRMLSNCLSRET